MATGTSVSRRLPRSSQPCCCCRAPATSWTLTHGDALHLVANARSLLPLRAGDERLALLPMCQVMERVLGLYLSLDARVISNYLENPDTAHREPAGAAADGAGHRSAHLGSCCTARVGNAATAATALQRMLYRWSDRRGCAWRPCGIAGALVRAARGPARTRSESAAAAPISARATLSPEIERWAAALGITIRHIDGQAARGPALDARYQALMQEAYGT